MTWVVLLALAAVSYGLKAVGPVLAGGRQLGPGVRRALDLAAVPLLAALILTQTVGDGHRLVLDARLPALAVAAVLVWRRAPFLVVVLAAAGTAALLRALGPGSSAAVGSPAMTEGYPEPPAVGTEAATLLGSLERQRATLAWKCADLDDAGLRATVGVSAVTLGGLLKHLAFMEDVNFTRDLAGRCRRRGTRSTGAPTRAGCGARRPPTRPNGCTRCGGTRSPGPGPRWRTRWPAAAWTGSTRRRPAPPWRCAGCSPT